MEKYQKAICEDNVVTITRGKRVERHEFKTEEEAVGRLAIVEEAFSWIGTPFVDCACVKGRGGAVDCAMLLRACYVDTGRLEDFDPRPYPPRWHVHNDEELFLQWLVKLGAKEVGEPRLADIVVYRFGRTFSHGAIVVNSTEIVHAYHAAGMVLMSGMEEPVLGTVLNGKPRARKFYDVWSK